jgi:molybdopterin converting factor small subunit
MTVTVRLFATFREFLPREATSAAWVVAIAANETVQSLLATLQLPEDLPRIVLVNGKYAMDHDPLYEGDHIAVFPPLIGGQHQAAP